jgi:putative DNA primase/helicase
MSATDWLPAEQGDNLRSFPLTDSGNGERIAQRFSKEIRYCFGEKTWYTYTGRRWEHDQTGSMFQRAKLIARLLYEEAAHAEDSESRKKCSDWARKCESADRLRAMLFCAQSEPGIAVLPSQFDSYPFLLNCLNGTIDLTTGKLREHRREELITKLAPVEYDDGARSQLWERFLHETTAGDKELQDFLQRAAGYSLTGSVIEEVLFFVHGPGGSGKSTYLEAKKTHFGDYARVADFESFIQRGTPGAVRNDIAELAGRRLVISIEVDDGKRLAEGLLKTLTGGDTVRARFLYQEAFEFPPQFKLWLCANNAPKVNDADSAVWRRILRIPFDHAVPKEQRDPTLKARLKDPETGRAILAWAVRGCLRWQVSGLSVPKVVEQATDAYRAQMDPLRDFLDDRCILRDNVWITAAALRAEYERWAKDTGEGNTLDAKDFGNRLKARGCKQSQRRVLGKHTRGWEGIGLRGEQ